MNIMKYNNNHQHRSYHRLSIYNNKHPPYHHSCDHCLSTMSMDYVTSLSVVAGAVGGALGVGASYPLDKLKTGIYPLVCHNILVIVISN